jgi:uncharacterized RDD family membrane protein YckC
MLYDALIVLGLLIIAGALALPITGDRVQAGVWFTYLGWCWTHGGQTLGLRAWRVRLEADHAVGWRTSALRFLVSLLSAGCLGLGFWLSLLRSDRACWHDRASGTRLVHHPRQRQLRKSKRSRD